LSQPRSTHQSRNPLPYETEAALVAYIERLERWARVAWRACSAPVATGGP
jgi:hypothetical protein